jgi:50S ribosomal subunit-associated GTPase HflX
MNGTGSKAKGETTIDTLESRLSEALDTLEEELEALKHYMNHKQETL